MVTYDLQSNIIHYSIFSFSRREQHSLYYSKACVETTDPPPLLLQQLLVFNPLMIPFTVTDYTACLI